MGEKAEKTADIVKSVVDCLNCDIGFSVLERLVAGDISEAKARKKLENTILGLSAGEHGLLCFTLENYRRVAYLPHRQDPMLRYMLIIVFPFERYLSLLQSIEILGERFGALERKKMKGLELHTHIGQGIEMYVRSRRGKMHEGMTDQHMVLYFDLPSPEMEKLSRMVKGYEARKRVNNGALSIEERQRIREKAQQLMQRYSTRLQHLPNNGNRAERADLMAKIAMYRCIAERGELPPRYTVQVSFGYDPKKEEFVYVTRTVFPEWQHFTAKSKASSGNP